MMENQTISKPRDTSNFRSSQALRLTKTSLIIFLLGISVVGKNESGWPIITWILYSGNSPRFFTPEPSVSAVELRVYTTAGDLHIIKPEQILTVPYDSLSHSIVEQAFDNADGDLRVRDESRRYLMSAVAKMIPENSEIETIEAWRLSYQVEPLSVPPIQVEDSSSEVKIDSFSKRELVKNN